MYYWIKFIYFVCLFLCVCLFLAQLTCAGKMDAVPSTE